MNFYQELKKYFETTPREKVLEDWEKSKHFDSVGPTVEEFLTNSINKGMDAVGEIKVKDLIEKLKTMDPEAVICSFELDGYEPIFDSFEIVEQLNDVEYIDGEGDIKKGNIVRIF